jgi:hypothetical protein
MSDRANGMLWTLLLTAASVATTVVLACATPFAALAALAAVHMRRRDGVPLMLAAWAACQAIGFGLLGYPRDAGTFGWGLALAIAALAALYGADAAARRAEGSALRIVIAYGAAFVAFKAVILIGTLAMGSGAAALSPAVVARGFVRDGAILAGLLMLYRGLVRLGVPPAPRPAVA